MTLRLDRSATDGRRAALEAYASGNIANHESGLICQWAARCAESALAGGVEFYGGQLGHVGRCFDLVADGRALRLLVIGQEFGRRPDSIPIGGRATGGGDVVTIDERHADLVEYRGQQRFSERNPHMRGTSLAVRTVLEAAVGIPDPGSRTDHAGETFRDQEGSSFHMFDAFAFTNMLLCSATPPESSRGRPTVEMRRNCRHHLARTIEQLEPTIVVVQKAPSAALSASWLGPLLRRRGAHPDYPNLWQASIVGVSCALVAVNHPSTPNAKHGWPWPTSPYWLDVVRPALIAAVRGGT